ncbi:MAG: PAS domain-containing protein [Rhodobacteraceae bacterium]|nr:PAS domain-containing protein [Paracoccaceae bacterium]
MQEGNESIPRRNPALEMADGSLAIGGFENAAQVLACWETARAGRPMALRREIDPATLGQALAQCFVAEVVAPQVARLRIAGSGLHDLMGMDVRGMPLTAFLTGTARAEVMQAVAQVRRGARVKLPLIAPAGPRQPAMDGLLMLLPLSSDGRRIDLVLGALDTSGVIGAAPRRFRMAAGRPRLLADRTAPLLQGLRGIDRSAQTPATVARRGHADPEAARAARRVRLRVIDGGLA